MSDIITIIKYEFSNRDLKQASSLGGSYDSHKGDRLAWAIVREDVSLVSEPDATYDLLSKVKAKDTPFQEQISKVEGEGMLPLFAASVGEMLLVYVAIW